VLASAQDPATTSAILSLFVSTPPAQHLCPPPLTQQAHTHREEWASSDVAAALAEAAAAEAAAAAGGATEGKRAKGGGATPASLITEEMSRCVGYMCELCWCPSAGGAEKGSPSKG